MRDTVRDFVDDRFLPTSAMPGRAGSSRGAATELGELGLLGMHLEGYGCAGERDRLRAGVPRARGRRRGLRSFVSVQGSLAMFAIHSFGSEEQKQQWLPAMAAGEAIGCFGLTEPDSGRTRARCVRPRARRRRLGAQRHEDVDHER